MSDRVSWNPSLRILLVEDNPADARLIREELNEPAVTHEVFHCGTIGEAMKRMALLPPDGVDVVLLDLSLPDVQGLEGVEKMRSAAPWLPIVVLTGLDDDGTAFRAVEEGVQDYLVKGKVSGSVLVRALRYAIERKRAEESIRRQREAERNAELRETVMVVLGHDLRTPLQSITLSAALLLQSAELSAHHTKLARRIGNSADRMGKMIDDILDFARARLGDGFILDRVKLDAAEICRQVIDEIEQSAPGRTVSLSVDGDVRGTWDRTRLAQIVSNLVGNAVRHSPEGTAVRVALRDDGANVYLEVHNAGPPIPEGLRPHLFEPFHRSNAKERGPRSGLGLGLFITKQLASAHGGAVSVRSAEDQGTTFTVKLPRQ